MDDFEQPKAPKLGDKEVLQPDDVTPTEEMLPQPKTEVPAETSQVPAPEPPQLHGKSRGKVVLIVSAVVLAFAAVGGVVWFVLANNTAQGDTNGGVTNQPSEIENNDSETSADEPEPKDEVVELSVDDLLVRRLRNNFRDDYIYVAEGASSGALPINLMMWFAAQNFTRTFCKMPYDVAIEKRYADYAVDYPEEVWQIYASGCYKGDDILFKVKDMFGIDIPLVDGVKLFRQSFAPYTYSAEYDEFFREVLRAGGANPPIIYATYAAEKTKDHVFIYDVAGVAYGTYDFDGKSYEFAGPISPEETCHFSEYNDARCRIDYTLDENTILEHLDDYTKFKWTFVWNGENYIFEKLEWV